MALSYQQHHRRLTLGFRTVALTLVSLLATSFAYQSGNKAEQISAKQFIGTWKAEFKGQTYCIIRIASVSPKIIGTFSNASRVDVGDDGNVKDIGGTEELLNSTALLEPRIDGNKLIFKWKEGEDLTTLELALSGPDDAGLRFVDMTDPDDQARIGKMKPFPMKRVKDGSK